MDLLKTVREIGFFETARNLSDVLGSEAVQMRAGDSLPLPYQDMTYATEQAAMWLSKFGKSRYLFLTPEIALIEKMHVQGGEAIITIPCDMESETKVRLQGNLPPNMKVSVLEEPYFPDAFYPGNGLLVVCGYTAGERIMVLPETYRLIEHYGGFLGKKVFVPYVSYPGVYRYKGWMEVDVGKFSAMWRNNIS